MSDLVLFCFKQIHGQCRHKRTGQEVRRKHREYDRFGQRYEEVAGNAAQKEHRQEHDADTQRGHQGGDSDLGRAV
jgi:hypothetical protein